MLQNPTYLKIILDNNQNVEKNKPNKFLKLLKKISRKIIPLANPDFEDKILETNIWLIEFDNENIPVREIGMNNLNEPIMIMPYKNNYGFWTDNNLKLEDFKNGFEVYEIDKDVFENNWKKFVKKDYS
ncbi:hypothetical protein [Faecalibacter rhinopitheci]|uniref:Uncharacterized protein n=1 Tax=Faecalibacter rhinopitheci TaxID=2779678 RepID=A0A8J7GA91_9FLAO|nr:hypothetical protein [Faecalibacter rhinopitheci]MBF0598445.1 hypothetical protein [Faecalibacter rhinopitheci]